MNNVSLVGRLTKDVELKSTQSGAQYVRFTLAVNRDGKPSEGKPNADFVPCIAWNKAAENMARFLAKGSMIAVTGRIQTGSYDGKDGQKVYTFDVVAFGVQFLDPKKDATAPAAPAPAEPPAPATSDAGYEEIPF